MSAVAPCHKYMTVAALIPRYVCCLKGLFHGQGAWIARVLRIGCIGRSVQYGRLKLCEHVKVPVSYIAKCSGSWIFSA